MALDMTSHKGYFVVEPNHLSAPRNGQVYGQLPAADGIEILEQGTFVKYDYANGEVNFSGEGPWMMVFNEEKLYDERHQMHRDYAMKAADFYDGKMYPRVLVMHAGDIFTTNAVADGTYSVGQVLTPGAEGILEIGSGDLECTIVKEYTMPDGQPGLKLQVTKA